MNEDAQRFIQASIQEGIQQALRGFAFTRGQATSDSSDVESDAIFKESFEDGIELPEEISGLFPDIPSKGRIPKEAFRKILEQNPEPNQGILKPPKLDRYIQTMLPQEVIKRDEVLMAMQADTGRIVRPIIAIMAGAAPIDNEARRKCKQSIIWLSVPWQRSLCEEKPPSFELSKWMRRHPILVPRTLNFKRVALWREATRRTRGEKAKSITRINCKNCC